MPSGKGRRRTTVGGRAEAKYEVRSTKYEVWKFGATGLRGIWLRGRGGVGVVERELAAGYKVRSRQS